MVTILGRGARNLQADYFLRRLFPHLKKSIRFEL